MNAAHTPGPWAYRPDTHDDWGTVRAGRYHICQARDPRYVDDEYLRQCRVERRDPWEANARLIAAAPELLAALECTVDCLEYIQRLEKETSAPILGWGVRASRIHAARAAIAKARGQA